MEPAVIHEDKPVRLATVHETLPIVVPEGGTPVIVCTAYQGVFFGYATSEWNALNDDPLILARMRMVIYWDEMVSGVLGLAEVGPNSKCRISGTAPLALVRDISAVFFPSGEAVRAFLAAPAAGREK